MWFDSMVNEQTDMISERDEQAIHCTMKQEQGEMKRL